MPPLPAKRTRPLSARFCPCLQAAYREVEACVTLNVLPPFKTAMGRSRQDTPDQAQMGRLSREGEEALRLSLLASLDDEQGAAHGA